MKYYLAIDFGASSGRHILASVQDGKILLEEVYRFKNYVEERNGHLCWNLDRLFNEIKNGLKKCTELGKIPSSVGIDTWGVEFVLLDKDDKILGDTIAYRDNRTEGIPEKIYASGLTRDDLYRKTGIQKQLYNSIFQLAAIKEQHPEEIEAAESLLFLPCYFSYLLSGVKQNEYTIASTSGLLNAENKDWDKEIIEKLGLPEKLFGSLAKPSTVIGSFTKEIADEIGFTCDVVLPCAHDTGSAVLATPMVDGEGVYISSGTWSLMGAELKKPICTKESDLSGFSNEGGINYTVRYLKNIMGLWIIQSIKRELNDEYSFNDLEQMARKCADFDSVVDVNDNRFLAPKSMIEAIKSYCKDHGLKVPESIGEVMECAYISLAKCYDVSIKALEEVLGRKYESIRIVGGGSQDKYLNELTALVTGKTVYAGPIEATALGNILAQLLGDGTVKDVEEARSLIRNSFPIKEIKG